MADDGWRAQLRLQVEYVALSTLKANPLNPRVYSPRQIKALCRSIHQHGFVVPAIIDRDGRMTGHARATRRGGPLFAKNATPTASWLPRLQRTIPTL